MLGFMIILGMTLLVVLISIIIVLWHEYQNRKFVKNHSDYIALQNEVIEKGNATWEWRNLINQKKKAIDEVLAEMPYLTAREREKAEKQINEWRIDLFLLKEDAKPYFEEHIALREKLNAWHDELVKSGELKEW
jgi:hypothetical protein